MCPGISYPILYSNLLYKRGNYFLDTHIKRNLVRIYEGLKGSDEQARTTAVNMLGFIARYIVCICKGYCAHFNVHVYSTFHRQNLYDLIRYVLHILGPIASMCSVCWEFFWEPFTEWSSCFKSMSANTHLTQLTYAHVPRNKHALLLRKQPTWIHKITQSPCFKELLKVEIRFFKLQ